MKHSHAATPGSVRVRAVCAAIETALAAVARHSPRALARVRARVVKFRLLTRAEQADGTHGEFMRRKPRLIGHPVFGEVYEDEDDRQGVIALSADADVGEIAREFGHVVTSVEDRARRNAPDDEGASGLAADDHASRWGFGRAIARRRPARSLAHHSVGPRQRVGLGGDLNGTGTTWYRVSRRFVMHRIEASRAPILTDEQAPRLT